MNIYLLNYFILSSCYEIVEDEWENLNDSWESMESELFIEPSLKLLFQIALSNFFLSGKPYFNK